MRNIFCIKICHTPGVQGLDIFTRPAQEWAKKGQMAGGDHFLVSSSKISSVEQTRTWPGSLPAAVWTTLLLARKHLCSCPGIVSGLSGAERLLFCWPPVSITLEPGAAKKTRKEGGRVLQIPRDQPGGKAKIKRETKSWVCSNGNFNGEPPYKGIPLFGSCSQRSAASPRALGQLATRGYRRPCGKSTLLKPGRGFSCSLCLPALCLDALCGIQLQLLLLKGRRRAEFNKSSSWQLLELNLYGITSV